MNHYGSYGITFWQGQITRRKRFRSGYIGSRDLRFAGQVLAQRHRKLTDFAREEVSSWNRNQCRKRLKTLEIAREIYEIECRQRVRGQRVMTEWLEARLIHDTAD